MGLESNQTHWYFFSEMQVHTINKTFHQFQAALPPNGSVKDLVCRAFGFRDCGQKMWTCTFPIFQRGNLRLERESHMPKFTKKFELGLGRTRGWLNVELATFHLSPAPPPLQAVTSSSENQCPRLALWCPRNVSAASREWDDTRKEFLRMPYTKKASTNVNYYLH